MTKKMAVKIFHAGFAPDAAASMNATNKMAVDALSKGVGIFIAFIFPSSLCLQVKTGKPCDSTALPYVPSTPLQENQTT